MIIFKESIRRILKSKVKFAVLMLAPFIFIAMFALIDQFYISVGVVDNDNSNTSKRLIESLDSSFKVVKLEGNQVVDNTVSHIVSYSIIIDKGFEEKIIGGENPKIKEFYISENEKLHSVRMLVNNYIGNVKTLAKGTNYDKEKFTSAFNNYLEGNLQTQIASKDEENRYKTNAAMGFLVQFMLYMSILTAGLILEDKAKGTFFRTFYAPVSLKRYLFENLAAFVVIASIQVTVVFTALKAFFNMDFAGNFLNMYLLFIVFGITCVSFGIWVISLFKKPPQAYTAVVLITTPLVMLGGCYWPREMMPDIMIKVSAFIPTTWVMEGVNKLLFEGRGLTGIILEIGILLLFTTILFAAGLFKKVDIAK